jgi:hypothetical protein
MQPNTGQSPTILSQRRGKIARLPRGVRDQLNVRLDDGQEADDILPWLNGLPEVQKIITERFNGVPISPQNLSAWRQGGFQEWLLHRQLLDSSVHVREHLQELEQALDCDSPDGVPLTLADNMITQLSIRFNAFLARWGDGPLDTQMATLLKIGQFILKLQRAAYRAQREAIELPGLRRQSEREYKDEIRAEAFRDYIAESAAARKAAKSQRAEKSKKPISKSGPAQPAEAAPTAAQSSPIKLNQGSPESSSNQPPAPVVVHLPMTERVNERR